MELYLIHLVLILTAYVTSAWLPRRLASIAWLVPLGIAAWWFAWWLDERQPLSRATISRAWLP